jgi:hypothetical protein
MKVKRSIALVFLLTIAGLAPAPNPAARACNSTDGTAPHGCLWSQWRRYSPTPTITDKLVFTTLAPPVRATVAAM